MKKWFIVIFMILALPFIWLFGKFMDTNLAIYERNKRGE